MPDSFSKPEQPMLTVTMTRKISPYELFTTNSLPNHMLGRIARKLETIDSDWVFIYDVNHHRLRARVKGELNCIGNSMENAEEVRRVFQAQTMGKLNEFIEMICNDEMKFEEEIGR